MVEQYKETIKRIQPIAKSYIIKHNIKYPITDTMQYLTQQGYYIIKSPAPTNLSGFYMKKDKYPFIFVNSNHTLGRQNFSLWHEVYHHLMNHQNGISDFGSKTIEEREAEIFAGNILLPDHEIDKWNQHNYEDPATIAKISSHYQMSFQGTLVRLMQYNKLSYESYQKLKTYSTLENQDKLRILYEENELDAALLYSTKNTQISENIMKLLQSNYEEGKISGEKINEIIEKIEGLNDES